MLRREAAKLASAWANGRTLVVSWDVYQVASIAQKHVGEPTTSSALGARLVVDMLTAHNVTEGRWMMHALLGFEAGKRHQHGLMPLYFKRLDEAEKLCEHIEQHGCSNGAAVADLLFAWRKAKEATT